MEAKWYFLTSSYKVELLPIFCFSIQNYKRVVIGIGFEWLLWSMGGVFRKKIGDTSEV